MGTLRDTLKAISTYPIPAATLEAAAAEWGFSLDDESNPEVLSSPEFKCLKADIHDFLASAPNISEGGVSFSFSSIERKTFSRKAERLRMDSGLINPSDDFGYQGTDF